ncbi:flavin-containing monooxygenase [Saccharopolyspora sp. CA-218241]|uniref:flavin-containing monooxygenase n=1 Tax=Saccharopolyspora sp. CA-218241 TaxID=3240027 RepID=UPI003D99BF1A
MRKAAMPMLSSSTPEFSDAEVAALRERYRAERERRVRPDGSSQYRRAEGRFGYYAEDPYAEVSSREPLTDRVDAVVIGGGFGGLCAGARLRQAGLERIRIIEKGGDFGGTWYWNRYPGIHCDIESYVYLPLLEEVGYVPRWKYSPGEEIRQHAMAIGREFDLYRNACFQTGVRELCWDDGEWIVRTDRDDEMRATYVVVSNSTLDHPKLPGIPGIEDFAGHTFHTSRWDYGYTGGGPDGGLTGLADKRVAVIGTGATAIQVVPHLARDAEHLYVFQRTPSSVDVRDNRATDPEWAASLEPGWHARRRENFQAVVTGNPVAEDLVDDAWTASANVLGKIIATDARADWDVAEWERVEELLDFEKMNRLRTRVEETVDDPATAELLKPWYRYGCKRPTFSDEYLPAFNRSNVTLVDTADHGGVERITERSLIVGGREYEVDCIIFATGFEVGRSDVVTGRLPILGRDGEGLLEKWFSNGVRTLHGFYSNGFPNLFHLGSTQNAPSVNFVHVLDEQAIHIGAVVAEARRRGVKCIEPSAAAETAWVETLRASSPERAWFDAECTPGYYNDEGTAHGRTTYGRGPAAFQRLLREWRTGDGIDEVLGDAN